MIKFKKIYRYIITSLCMLLFASLLQAQSFNWVKRAGGPSNENSTKMCMDLNGNIYVAFSGAGPEVYFASDTLIVNGQNDMFLVKYDASGNEIWKLQFGGPNQGFPNIIQESIICLIFDSSSNCIFLSGSYYESCTIDTVSISTMPSSVHSFVAKIDMNGTCIWAKNFGGNLFAGSPPLFDNDKLSNLYFLSYSPNSSFLDTFPVSSGGYLGKMDTDGSVSYIKKFCRSDTQFPRPAFIYSKLIYKGNRLYLFGATLDSVTIDTIFIPNTSFTNLVVSMWDTTGSIVWARNSDNSNVSAGDFNVSDKGSVYLASGCDGPIITFQNDTVFINSTNGGFLLKYNKDGIIQWHKSFVSGQHVSFRSSLLDEEENIYFTGAFKDSVNFNFQTIYSSSSFNELYIASFDSIGSCIGVRSAGPADGFDILKSVNNEIYVTGELRNTATFGSISIPSYGSSDMFLANLSAITGSGGNERAINNQLIIYANPNKGSFRIKLPDAITDLTGAILTVYDVQGKEVARFNLEQTSDHPQLEINNAISGFYTVRLVKGKQVFNGKLVVE